jgi:predicted dehydrogenase
MVAEDLGVALVGYGMAGRIHAPLIVATQGLALRRVVSSDAAKVHADLPDARVSSDLEEVLGDPAVGLVVVATPNTLHAPQAHAALEAGKHVVVDKPFTVTTEEARGLVEHAERAGRLLSVFHNRRWDGDFLVLRRLVAEGALGEVTQFESHFDRFRPEVRDRWREQDLPGSGTWMDLGPHLVDQALQLFGPPLAVFADIAGQRAGARSDDYFHVLLRYPTLRVILHGSTLMAASDLRFAVHGTRSSFIKHGLDTPEHGTLTRVVDDHPVATPVPSEPASWRAYYEAVRDAIVGVAPNPVPTDQALQVMVLLELALQSARAHRELDAGSMPRDAPDPLGLEPHA